MLSMYLCAARAGHSALEFADLDRVPKDRLCLLGGFQRKKKKKQESCFQARAPFARNEQKESASLTLWVRALGALRGAVS